VGVGANIRLLSLIPYNAVNNTSQQDFVPRKVYCVSNVTFHAESKYANMQNFSITHSFCTMAFFIIDFSKF
jgi:hypothetical protein